MPPRAIVAGHLCLDITPDFMYDALPAPGHVTHVGPATFSTGGAASNTGLDMIKLGIDTRLCARVGDDSTAQTVAGILDAQAPGSSKGLVVVAGEATSYTIILSPLGKDRAFVHFAGANESFCSADITDEMLAAADLLHLGYPPALPRFYIDNGRELAALLQRAKAMGVTTGIDLCMLDPDSENSRYDWRSILESVLPYVDLFLPSMDELLLMYDPALYQTMAREGSIAMQVSTELLRRLAGWAMAAGAKIVMLKASTRGIYLRTAPAAALAGMGRARPQDIEAWASRELWAAPFRLEHIATTTGAGDAAVAGMLAALLRGKGPEQALTVATAAGACACEAPGATSGLLAWNALLRSHQQRLAPPVERAAGCRLDRRRAKRRVG